MFGRGGQYGPWPFKYCVRRNITSDESGKKQKKPKQIAVGFLLSKRAKIPRPMERLDWCIRIETNMTSRN